MILAGQGEQPTSPAPLPDHVHGLVIPGSFAAPREMHAVPAHQGGHPLSRLPLIDDGVVRCANQGCTLCLADTDPVAEGLAAVKSTLSRCQNRGDSVRFRASH